VLISIVIKKYREAIYERFKITSYINKWKEDHNRNQKVILLHAASMGEFEHIKPLIYNLSKQAKYSIVLTFFSPSGYNHVRSYPGIDLIIYSPLDLKSHVKKFYRLLKPEMLVISKHDAWPNQVWIARDFGIKIFLVNASLSQKSSRIRPYIKYLFNFVYQSFDKIYVSNEEDKSRFNDYFSQLNLQTVGDTKFDQVLIRKELSKNKNYIGLDWKADNLIFIAGSIWKEDGFELFPVLKALYNEVPNLKIILVPHQIDHNFLKSISDFFGIGQCSFYSSKLFPLENRIIIVDVIGILADLYRYADIAYVGGSFRQGIHNVMEPAVYGIPVLYGPKYENSTEAIKLLQQKGSRTFKTGAEFKTILNELIQNIEIKKELGTNAQKFAMDNIGATDKIAKELAEYLS
jgi:3-deoxy-D-manno-octulosonic-acid transferase